MTHINYFGAMTPVQQEVSISSSLSPSTPSALAFYIPPGHTRTPASHRAYQQTRESYGGVATPVLIELNAVEGGGCLAERKRRTPKEWKETAKRFKACMFQVPCIRMIKAPGWGGRL